MEMHMNACEWMEAAEVKMNGKQKEKKKKIFISSEQHLFLG